jgi:cytidylate kinase
LISSHIGFPIISFGGILRDYSTSNGLPTARIDLQRFGQEIIDKFGFEGFVEWMIDHSAVSWDSPLIIDGLRHRDIYGHILRMFPQTFLVYCDCDLETQISRILNRDGIGENEAKQILSHETEMHVEDLRAVAQLVFQPDDRVEYFIKQLNDYISQMRI